MSKIYITGDCHGDFFKFSSANFPQGKELNKNDYVIICGDVGIVWDKELSEKEKYWINWLENKPWTTLFVLGNHENYDRWDKMPVEEWHGGKIQRLSPSVIHLMRGQVFEINGKTFATMGGAPSHDIQDGVFDPADYETKEDMRADIARLVKRKGGWQYALYRVKGVDWWERETPSTSEWLEWHNNLARYDGKIDYILTHEAPASAVPFVGIYPPTEMSEMLEEFRIAVEYKHWFFAHYHIDKYINDKETCLYDKLVRVE